jgi:hypothetical protein
MTGMWPGVMGHWQEGSGAAARCEYALMALHGVARQRGPAMMYILAIAPTHLQGIQQVQKGSGKKRESGNPHDEDRGTHKREPEPATILRPMRREPEAETLSPF